MNKTLKIGRNDAIIEFGKQWDERVPRAAIVWLMDRVHVGTSDAKIERSIRARIAKSPDAAAFTKELIEQSVAYALECHRRNQATYRAVNSGFLGDLRKAAPNGLK